MIPFRLTILCMALLLAACNTGTIAQIKDVKVDLTDEKIDGVLDQAIQSYQTHLDKMPESEMPPDSILSLADLKIKKEYDFSTRPVVPSGGDVSREIPVKSGDIAKEAAKPVPGGDQPSPGAKEAIALYRKLLKNFPNFALNDHALYQLGRIYEELGNTEEAMSMMDRLAKGYPKSRYIDEVQFRRGEYYYARKKFPDAKVAYKAIVDMGAGSYYYEFALNKLGWTYFKQELYEDAMRQFIALLDHKVKSGYDLEHPKDAFEAKRIADIYRVISLSFSYMGGPDEVAGYFQKNGRRSYEMSIYKDMGDYYLETRRYGDAAAVFNAFVNNNPYHKKAPYFAIWVIDSYKKGNLPTLVMESNKALVDNYGFKSEYWTRFNIANINEVPGYVATFNEVSGYLLISLKELVNYYHAQYQDTRLIKSKNENFREAVKWYREFLGSFPREVSALAIHNQLAELLLENKGYGQAAIEYEHIAYDYPSHAKSSDAGYTAIYAYRKSLAIAPQEERDRVRRDVISSSLRYAKAFPKENEKAALVMSAVLDDIYGVKDYQLAAATARKMIARYSGAEQSIRRAAWLIFAHSSLELGLFKDAEEGYLSALDLTPKNDISRPGLIENLAAAFYKQGEKANKLGNYGMAATYFLLVGKYASTSSIRPVADFDGATALMQLKSWDKAAEVFRSLRFNYPGHRLQPEVTKKIAYSYKEGGKPSLAAAEYQRIGTESADLAIRREALQLAAELYIQAKEMDKVYPVYRLYVNNFQKPLEYVLELRNKLAAHLKAGNDRDGYFSERKQIMEADATGGAERTDRTRYLGGTAALELTELTIQPYNQIKLVKPFDKNLQKKKESMLALKGQLEKLFDYEVDEVTSAATYYLADIYFDFNRALVESERPVDLNALEKEQYELSIEEQAFPFEEKAIQVHQENLDLMPRGIYNSWIDKSIGKLAILVPARYAKFEESSGYIDEIDTVNYEALVSPRRVSADQVQLVTPPVVDPASAQKASNEPK